MAQRHRLLAHLCALVTLALLVPIGSSASRSSRAAAVDSSIFEQLNAIRVRHGLVPLTLNPGLNEAAQEHSRQMVSDGYFAHSSLDGSPFWKRIERYYSNRSYRFWAVGENIFWGVGPTDASASIRAWMASPAHRANILSPTWRQIGIGATSSSRAPGPYDGRAVTAITTDFGARH